MAETADLETARTVARRIARLITEAARVLVVAADRPGVHQRLLCEIFASKVPGRRYEDSRPRDRGCPGHDARRRLR
jgi:hypothetical protein